MHRDKRNLARDHEAAKADLGKCQQKIETMAEELAALRPADDDAGDAKEAPDVVGNEEAEKLRAEMAELQQAKQTLLEDWERQSDMLTVLRNANEKLQEQIKDLKSDIVVY